VKILGFFDGGVVVDERGRVGCGDTAGTDVDEARVLLISAGVGGFVERLITCEWNFRIGVSNLERSGSWLSGKRGRIKLGSKSIN
jgi:hypothetical protein